MQQSDTGEAKSGDHHCTSLSNIFTLTKLRLHSCSPIFRPLTPWMQSLRETQTRHSSGVGLATHEAQDAEASAQVSRGAEAASLKCLVWEFSVSNRQCKQKHVFSIAGNLYLVWFGQSKRYSLFF